MLTTQLLITLMTIITLWLQEEYEQSLQEHFNRLEEEQIHQWEVERELRLYLAKVRWMSLHTG